MKRQSAWIEKHSVVVVASITLLVAAVAAYVVLSTPVDSVGDRVLSTVTSVVTIAAFIVAIVIYLAQRSESRMLSESEAEGVAARLDAASEKRGVQRHVKNRVDRRSLSGKRVLWVDDRPKNCVDEVHALRDAGASITFVLSTAEGQAQLVSSSYDVVVSDMSRPEAKFAGYDLLDFANRYVRPKVPFILYTGTATPEQVDESRRRGAHTQVNDPWALQRSVTNALLEATPEV